MRKYVRNSMILAAIGALALALSGCVTIEDQGSTQLDNIGSVQVITRAEGNSGAGSAQVLLAYRIPSAAAAPAVVDTIATTGGPGFRFNLSSSYSTELESKSPPQNGQKWVGYLSPTLSFGAGTKDFTIAPAFGLRQGSDGSPFQGPFDFRTIVGWRAVDGTRPADRPVVCGTPITTEQDGTDCASDPESTSTIAMNVQQPTQDLGILEPSSPDVVRQGNVARLAFDAVFAGDGNLEPTFSMSASTDVPDAEAMPSTPTLTPAEGSNPSRVIFRVPVDTPPGTYYVTLTAALANGQSRSSTRELIVTPTTVRCGQISPTIAGTRQNDVLKGTPGRDVIAGYLGDDRVFGLGGNDTICVGRGDDTVRGGDGNDRIAGRRGNDLLKGGRGHNLIRQGPGKDRFIQ